MKTVVIMGSNICPDIHIISGIKRLGQIGEIQEVSDAYSSPAFARPDQPDYINVAVSLNIDDAVEVDALRGSLREIEALEGRVRTEDTYAARTLDIDIVATDRGFVDDQALERDFVAFPVHDLRNTCRVIPVLNRQIQATGVIREDRFTHKLALEVP